MKLLEELHLEQKCIAASPLEEAFHQFLKEGVLPIQEDFDEWVNSWCLQEASCSKEVCVASWKSLLSLALFCDLTKLKTDALQEKIRFFEGYFSEEKDQYLRSLIAITHALVGLPVPVTSVHLLESGAALIDLFDYCPWLSLPFTPKHFELGIFLAILHLRQKEASDIRESVLKMARWQLNTLDLEGLPQSGLFVRELDGDEKHHLCTSYLLFRLASLFDKSGPYQQIAINSLQKIACILKKNGGSVDILWLMIEKYISRCHFEAIEETHLDEIIYDPSTALVGCRGDKQHVVCTLHGVQTGLGTIRQGDVSIVTYGPQYFPLNDCARFGIEGNIFTDKGIRKSHIDLRRHSFRLQGCVRLLDEPTEDASIIGKFRGIWVEVVQEFKAPLFSLKASFLCLDKIEGVAFSYFVKAENCVIGLKNYQKGKLEKYVGDSQPLLFQAGSSTIEICAPEYLGKIEVVPLGGAAHFWGADFLVAYLIEDEQKQVEWHIKLKETLSK